MLASSSIGDCLRLILFLLFFGYAPADAESCHASLCRAAFAVRRMGGIFRRGVHQSG
jgi:hypothetical protein